MAEILLHPPSSILYPTKVLWLNREIEEIPAGVDPHPDTEKILTGS